MLKATAWRVRVGDNNICDYRLQVNDVTFKSQEKILKVMENWNVSGEGFTENDKILYLFSKRFKDDEEWMGWAKQFPYELAELSSTSNTIKPIRLGATPMRRRGRPSKKCLSVESKKGRKQRICRRCGEVGHNVRTCRNPVLVKKVVVDKVKGKRQCSCCLQYGHNARTCVNKKEEK